MLPNRKDQRQLSPVQGPQHGVEGQIRVHRPKLKFSGLSNGECFSLLCVLASSCGSDALQRDHTKRKERGKISLFTSFHEEKAAICQMPLHINFAPLKAVMVQDKTRQSRSHYGWHIMLFNWFISPSHFFTHIFQQTQRLSLTLPPGRRRLYLGVSYKQTTANVLSKMKKGRSRTAAEIIHGLCWK